MKESVSARFLISKRQSHVLYLYEWRIKLGLDLPTERWRRTFGLEWVAGGIQIPLSHLKLHVLSVVNNDDIILTKVFSAGIF